MSNFECEICCYKTCRKWDFHKHMETKKHKREMERRECPPKTTFNDFSEKKSEKVVKSRKKSLKSPPKILQNPPKSSKNDFLGQKSPPISSDFLRFSSESPPISSDFLRPTTFFSEKKYKNPEKSIKSIKSIKISEKPPISDIFPPKTHKSTFILFSDSQNSSDSENNNFNPTIEEYEDHYDTIKETEEFKCDFCNKVFSRIDNYKRHLENRCKVKIKKEHEELLLLNDLKKEKEFMREQHEKDKEDYRKQIERLLDKVGTTNITNTNCGNTQTNNVQLNNFGQENLTMLTDKYMTNMVAYPYSAIPKMIKKIHFNDKFPENRNIRMLNKKDNKLQIRNNGEWEYVNKKETLQLLIEDKNYQLDKYYEDNKEKFDSRKQRKFENFQDKISIEDKKVNHEIKMDTELVFWNSM
jgi:hypothetical protein